jgi:hypothetical protein
MSQKSIYDRLHLLDTDPDNAGEDIEKHDIMLEINKLDDRMFERIEHITDILADIDEISPNGMKNHLRILKDKMESIKDDLY